MVLAVHVLLVGELSRVESSLVLDGSGDRFTLVELVEGVVVARVLLLVVDGGPVEDGRVLRGGGLLLLLVHHCLLDGVLVRLGLESDVPGVVVDSEFWDVGFYEFGLGI